MNDIWRKSSYSVNNGACVEVAWHKSSYSGGTECVETLICLDCGMVHVRDSKDRDGPVLGFTRAEWAEFTQRLRSVKTKR